ncbi:hypothetical protein AAG747_28010 [Rapidithrix thailandica]|uniref:Uncharacterized protein n=1 Tax=Rapidithrix thailandica TaxID=413964 RepID=A0AAW9SKY9_9BACT
MSWKIVERRIGQAGNTKQQQKRQREWDRKYGQNWMIGYMVDGEFISQEEALEVIYYQSYHEHFENHPDDLKELIHTAKALRNPHALQTGGVDLQVPTIMKFLERNALSLLGNEVVDIGTYGTRSHKISVRLSPLSIKVTGRPKMTLEQFWQDKKCLAVWEE